MGLLHDLEKKMNNLKSVLHISSARTWRGGEQQIAYLVEAVQARGIEQYVLCVEESPMAAWCQQHKINCITYKKRSSFSPKIGEKVAAISHIKKISIVHAHDSHAHTYAFLSIILNWNPTPIVVSRRVDFPVKKGWLSSWKYNHASIKRIICISDKIRSVVEKSTKDVTRLRVVHSGIDVARFQYKKSDILRTTYQVPVENKIIANIAAIAGHKDYFTFVDTAKYILEKGIKATFLIIGGDGGMSTKIDEYIKTKGLEHNIIKTGFREDIPQILPEVDVFLFTSKEEGLGTSVLDAFACQVPVVATRAGGIPEMVIHEVTGLLSDIGDSKNLASQVQRVLQNNDLKEQLTRNASTKLLAQFTKSSMAAGVLKVYEEVLNSGNQQ